MKFKSVGYGATARYFVDGVAVEREVYDRLMAQERSLLPQVAAPDDDLPGSRPWSQPIVSDALQVHPRQLEAVRERNAKHGLDIEYRPDGKPVLRDRKQRHDLLRVERMHDNNGGYAD